MLCSAPLPVSACCRYALRRPDFRGLRAAGRRSSLANRPGQPSPATILPTSCTWTRTRRTPISPSPSTGTPSMPSASAPPWCVRRPHRTAPPSHHASRPCFLASKRGSAARSVACLPRLSSSLPACWLALLAALLAAALEEVAFFLPSSSSLTLGLFSPPCATPPGCSTAHPLGQP